MKTFKRHFQCLAARFLLPSILLVALSSCSNTVTGSNAAYPSPLPSTSAAPRSTQTAAPAITPELPPPTPTRLPTSTTLPATQTPLPTVTHTPLPSPTATQAFSSTFSIGQSSNGWPIEVVRFGNGPLRLALVGGIHGGYEWNTIVLAYQAIDYFSSNPQEIPPEVSLFIIPAANPDGQVKVVGHTGRFSPKEVAQNTVPGRLNSNGVDLNRNWDCKWKPVGLWGDTKVSAGEKPFSEVETMILSNFLTQPPMAGVVFWHSAAAAIFPGGCNSSYAPSEALAKIFSEGSGYKIELTFSGYPVTGTEVDWLSTQGIPAIEVELNNHQDTDWEKNLKGISQVLSDYQALQQLK